MSIIRSTFGMVAAGWLMVGQFGFPIIGALLAIKLGVYQLIGQPFTVQPETGVIAWIAVPLLLMFGASWTLVYGYRILRFAVAITTSNDQQFNQSDA